MLVGLLVLDVDPVEGRAWLQQSGLWGLLVFVLAWIGQFIGHGIEGKRPSFFRDIQFLLIGPLWILADGYQRLGIEVR